MADQIVSISCAVDCPHCDKETYVEFDSLVGGGAVPRTYVQCDLCRKSFSIQSTLDIDTSSDDET
jgi:hypothetical protein